VRGVLCAYLFRAFDVFLKDFLDEKLQSPLNKIKVDDIDKIINLVEN
jgi:hypothetical protein